MSIKNRTVFYLYCPFVVTATSIIQIQFQSYLAFILSEEFTLTFSKTIVSGLVHSEFAFP